MSNEQNNKEMNDLKRQSIAQSFREGLTSYLNKDNAHKNGEHLEYFTEESNGNILLTDYATSYLDSWIECEHENDQEENKGTIDNWEDICVEEMNDYLDINNN